MRLADFIVANIEPILAEWEAFARGIAPGKEMDGLALRDHAGDILLATVENMRSAQSRDERAAKSRGHHRPEDGPALNRASELHAVDRLGSGFDLLEVVSEYRALRASVLRLWHDSKPAPHDHDVDDVTRFNESLDQSLAEAVSSYTRSVNQSRDLFLAILGHDLRTPLSSISMSASLLPRLFSAPEASGMVSQIATNAKVMSRMINDLLDYTRTRLGAGMPVTPTPMDLAALAHDLYEEFRSAHPDRDLRFHADGDFTGDWDGDRLRQALSNLLGNAHQHGGPRAPIDFTLRGDAAHITIAIHNGGPPIPPGELPKIFDPLVRGSNADQPRHNRPGSIGLGLYIAREIARSHGGRIDVTSSAADGTTFTLRLPRHHLQHDGQPILAERPLRETASR